MAKDIHWSKEELFIQSMDMLRQQYILHHFSNSISTL